MTYGSWVCADIRLFFFKQKTAYERRISDWSSDVCSSDLRRRRRLSRGADPFRNQLSRLSHHAAARGGLSRQARKSVVQGKSVSVRVDLGGHRLIKKKTGRRSRSSHESNKTGDHSYPESNITISLSSVHLLQCRHLQ